MEPQRRRPWHSIRVLRCSWFSCRSRQRMYVRVAFQTARKWQERRSLEKNRQEKWLRLHRKCDMLKETAVRTWQCLSGITVTSSQCVCACVYMCMCVCVRARLALRGRRRSHQKQWRIYAISSLMRNMSLFISRSILMVVLLCLLACVLVIPVINPLRTYRPAPSHPDSTI